VDPGATPARPGVHQGRGRRVSGPDDAQCSGAAPDEQQDRQHPADHDPVCRGARDVERRQLAEVGGDVEDGVHEDHPERVPEGGSDGGQQRGAEAEQPHEARPGPPRRPDHEQGAAAVANRHAGDAVDGDPDEQPAPEGHQAQEFEERPATADQKRGCPRQERSTIRDSPRVRGRVRRRTRLDRECRRSPEVLDRPLPGRVPAVRQDRLVRRRAHLQRDDARLAVEPHRRSGGTPAVSDAGWRRCGERRLVERRRQTDAFVGEPDHRHAASVPDGCGRDRQFDSRPRPPGRRPAVGVLRSFQRVECPDLTLELRAGREDGDARPDEKRRRQGDDCDREPVATRPARQKRSFIAHVSNQPASTSHRKTSSISHATGSPSRHLTVTESPYGSRLQASLTRPRAATGSVDRPGSPAFA